ncbi:MAG: multicopper oxidase domain-containing protein, partial [Betaproteobacteria bacterium]|nr:multicopper oxidase domain-containing protein [Betaproteobacteria bacterium]
MSNIFFGQKAITAISVAFTLFAGALASSPAALAASHNFTLTAEVLPNGQVGYKREDQAVIPGPTLFVKQGDTVNVSVTNNTGKPVGFKVPSLSNASAAKAGPGGTVSYSFIASKTGAHAYLGDGQELLGLFGAIVVDQTDGKVESYVNGDGVITSVNAKDLAKQYVLFMVGSTFWGAEISKAGIQTPLWTNPIFGAIEDDIVRFHVLSAGPGHTFHLHAHRWLEPGTSSTIDVKLLANGSDSHTFTVRAGTGVGPGNWQYHCHVFSHMEAGMHGSFRVDALKGSQKGPGNSIAGASPYGAIFGNSSKDPGLVTFVISDEPASWFRSARDNTIFSVTGSTRSLEVIPPGSSVNFIMAETNTVHSITSLLWPSAAGLPSNGHHSNEGNGKSRGRGTANIEHASMPFDQSRAYKGGGIVKLTTPGLYVFTCKVHPFMFAAVIVDDPATDGLDLGETINLATGIVNLPTSSDLATRLLSIFFIATAPNNWQNPASSPTWNITYPSVPVRITGGAVANLSDVLVARYGNNIALTPPIPPAIPGVGEVWVNTQFEKTAGKTKPGTITVVDTSTWKAARKIALPQINMNNPHNMWTNRDQSIVFQTQWFDNKMTMINQKTGALIKNIQVGEAPA